MSLMSDKDNDRCMQTGNTFYNCLLKLNSSINTFIQLLTNCLGSQIPSIIVNESGTVKDYFEEVVCSLKKVQGDIESKDKTKAECSQFSKLTATMSSILEKDPCLKNAKKLCESAKEISECAPMPLVLMLKNVNFFESMESALSQLMKSSIMNVRLTDLCKKDPCEQPGPAQASPSCCITSTINSPTDLLEKLSKLVDCQASINPTMPPTDNLQEIVKTMEPVADKLQQVAKAIEANLDLLKLTK
ncbi:uncharacterized protein C12orf60 homolog [Dromiciops gliroides]|uniref:uncharacterized protein C12orf60 homolog n=1 Tax=Dromiciops gliroides TaxID=33562 RepID=UPI001CC56FDE|nr:uncharacterized protein C12orf60 homolog [Dromiciops gliroides]XP_043823954.1 uncharacterized protein C12orf60 homolog [Dromiciops gliroides]